MLSGLRRVPRLSLILKMASCNRQNDQSTYTGLNQSYIHGTDTKYARSD